MRTVLYSRSHWTKTGQWLTSFYLLLIPSFPGSGAETGHRLGVQFCAISTGPAMMQSNGITNAVCNALESTACYNALDTYTNDNCYAAKQQTVDYYTQLSAVCEITQ